MRVTSTNLASVYQFMLIWRQHQKTRKIYWISNLKPVIYTKDGNRRQNLGVSLHTNAQLSPNSSTRLPTTTQIASPLLLPFSLGKMSSSRTDSQSKGCPSFLNITFFLKLLTFLFGTVFCSTRLSSLDFSVRFSQYEQFPQWLLVKFKKEFFHSS